MNQDFCLFQTRILQATQAVKTQFKLDKNPSSSNSIFQTLYFKILVQIDTANGLPNLLHSMSTHCEFEFRTKTDIEHFQGSFFAFFADLAASFWQHCASSQQPTGTLVQQLLKLSLVNSFISQLQQLPGDVNSVMRPLFKMMPLKSVHD